MSSLPATFLEIVRKLGLWLRGKFLIALILSVLTYAGLRVLGVEYSLPLALLAGFLDLIPVLGPLLTVVIVGLVALVTGNIVQAVWVVLLCLVLQQVEAFILEPRILAKSVGLNPWLVFVSIFVCSWIFGPLGALLAVPVLIVLGVLYATYYRKKGKPEKVLDNNEK